METVKQTKKEIEFDYMGDNLRVLVDSEGEVIEGFVWIETIQQDVNITNQLRIKSMTNKHFRNKLDVELFELSRQS